ncbi:hypothetical protein [Hymenobacter sp. BT730]|uniref:hypothetical protein n=1 Tax=Hymenobacter sp. BT730 TaxID=3063332 RepID=UPI0026DF6888|nr:hypothetical protein [Hymenobacter sp. BT730]
MHVPDFLHVAYRADLDILFGRWMRLVTQAEMQEGYQYLLEQAAAHSCQNWLLDARRRINTDKEGAQWMVQSFVAGAAARLGGRLQLAYLLGPIMLRNQEADAAFPPAAFFEGKPFCAERFIEEGEAIAWLQQHREAAV